MKKRISALVAITVAASMLVTPVFVNAAEEDLPEIYTLVEDTCLAGFPSPYIEDRSDIEKAWPKEAKDPEHLVIGYTELTLGNPWFADVQDAVHRKADEWGWTVNTLVCENDPVTQSEQFDTFISQGVDIIVVDAADMMGVIPDIQRAVDAGIPVLASACMITVSDAPILTSIASSPWGCGFDAGKYMATQYNSEEELVCGNIIGVLGNPASEGRVNGMLTGIIYQRAQDLGLEYTDDELYLMGYNFFQDIKNNGSAELEEVSLKVVNQLPGAWTEEGGMSAAEDIMTANPEVQLLVAENDWMGMGAYKALENMGLTESVKVGCAADGVGDAIKMVKDGQMLSTGCNSAIEQGEETMEFIRKIFAGELDPTNLPVTTYFPMVAITPDNVDEYYNPDSPYFDYQPMEFLDVPATIASLK